MSSGKGQRFDPVDHEEPTLSVMATFPGVPLGPWGMDLLFKDVERAIPKRDPRFTPLQVQVPQSGEWIRGFERLEEKGYVTLFDEPNVMGKSTKRFRITVLGLLHAKHFAEESWFKLRSEFPLDRNRGDLPLP